MKKILHRSLIAALILIAVILIYRFTHTPSSSPPSTLDTSDEIWIITDPHHLSPQLHDNGEAFQKMQSTSAGKDLIYSSERFEALIHQVAAEKPKALIVSGDLTFNGEYQSAVELANFFDRIEALGTTVLVEPGNHDIADGFARHFQAEKNIKIRQIHKSDFPSIFAHHGYQEAASRDAYSLSYLAKVFTNLWFLMIDSNIYTEQGDGKGAPNTNGVVRKETLTWMNEQLQLAQQAGIRVIPVLHHNVLDHHEQPTSGFTVDNASDVRALLAQYPDVTFGFSGHIHSQHIARETLMANHSYTEVVNGAFSIYPAVVGKLTYDTSGLHYRRSELETDAWAAATQQTNPDLLHHQEYLRAVFNDASHTLVHQSLYEEQWYNPDLANRISELFEPLNLAYFSGEMLDPQWITNTLYPSDAYQSLYEHRDNSFLYRYAQQIIEENKNANHLSVDVP